VTNHQTKPKALPVKPLHLARRQDWRAWLEKHHVSEKHVWLIIHRKHTGKVGLLLEEAVEEALCFGWIDGLLRPLDGERYALRFSPRKKGGHWSESNRKRVAKLIRQGRMAEAGLARVREAKENGEWTRRPR